MSSILVEPGPILWLTNLLVVNSILCHSFDPLTVVPTAARGDGCDGLSIHAAPEAFILGVQPSLRR